MLKTIRSKLFCILLFLVSVSNAQDTLNIMSYNLLNYSSIDGNKGRYIDLRNIIKNTNPDVMLVCEISSPGAPKYLLDSAFNKAGVGTYTRAAFVDGTDTDNMLFYKTSKVKLRSQKQIATALRDISQYLIYKVVATNDTAFLYLHMSHLKANTMPSDEAQRQAEVSAFCSDISSIPQSANIIFAGDMNFKGSTEAGYVTLTSSSCSHVFSDPINQPGLWNNNNLFSKIFTQSTRSSANPGCCGGSTGGIDDRFDLMMVTSPIMNGSNKITYLPGSYKAYGNDNQHMNLSLIDAPTNTVVSVNVAQSLFNMSDHLPVIMKVVLQPSVIGIKENKLSQADLNIRGINEGGYSYLGITASSEDHYWMRVIDIAGKEIAALQLELRAGYQVFDIRKLNLVSGLYHVILSNENASSHCLFSKTPD